MLANFSEVKSERTVFKFRKRKRKFLLCAHLLRNLKDVTKTGNGERGAGNGERKSGNESSAETSTKIQNGRPKNETSVHQKTRKRKKKTKKGIRALVEIRWGRNCKSESHFTFTF